MFTNGDRLGIGHNLVDVLARVITAECESALDFGVLGKPFRIGQVYRRARRIEFEVPLLGLLQGVGNSMRVREEE